MVSRCGTRCCTGPARQPDARHPARRRPRRFFILGVRVAAGEPARASSRSSCRPDAPDMFLIDIQQDQVDGVDGVPRSAQRAGAAPPRLIPVLRARVTGVQRPRGRRSRAIEDVRGRGSLAREYTDHLSRPRSSRTRRSSTGAFWDGDAVGRAREVSIEQSIRERFRIHVGDTMRFDVLGRTVEARVTSVRDVDWRRRRARRLHVRVPARARSTRRRTASSRSSAGPDDRRARARLQRDLVARFPNVSVIDVREVLDHASGRRRQRHAGVTVVGGLVAVQRRR